MENDRDYGGRYVDNDLGINATMREQQEGGVNYLDTEYTAQRKVEELRYGSSLPPPPPYVGGSDGCSVLPLIAGCIIVFLGIPLLLVAVDSRNIAKFIQQVTWTVGPVGLIGLPIIFILALKNREAVIRKNTLKKLAIAAVVWFTLRTLSFTLMPFIDVIFLGVLGWIVVKARPKLNQN